MELTEDIIGASFKTWRRNIKIGSIFFFGTILSYLPYLIYALYVYSVSKNAITKIEMLVNQSYSNTSLVTQNNLVLTSILNVVKPFLVEIIVGFILASIASYLIHEFFWCAGIKSCSLALEGRLSFSEAFKFTKSRYLTYIGAKILRFIIVFAVSLIPAVIGALILGISMNSISVHSVSSSKVLYMIPVIFLSILVFIIAYFLLVYVPYAVVEGHGAFDSLSASVRAVKHAFFETIAVLILSILIYIGCSAVGRIIKFFIPSPKITVLTLSAIKAALAVLALKVIIDILLMSFISVPLNVLFLLAIFKKVDVEMSQELKEHD